MQFFNKNHRLTTHAATLGLIAAVLLTGLSFAPHANAQITDTTRITRQSNVRHFTAQQVTASQTFAVTTYADLVGSQWTFTPMRYSGATEAPGVATPLDRYLITASLDVSKATATTGSCSVYVNGAVVASSERFIASAAGRGTLSILAAVTSTVTSGSQTIKLQCHSADTNTLTVNTGQVNIEEIY